MTRMTAGLAVGFALAVGFVATDAEAQRRGTPEKKSRRGATKEGQTVFRGGVSVDGGKTINLGGENNRQTTVVMAITPGVGYYFLDNASLDFDVEGALQLSPTQAFNSLGATPGVRYEISQVYARLGAPAVFYTPAGATFGLGVLGGVGYLQPLSDSTNAVFGVDYTYWLTSHFRRASPYGKLDFKVGVQQSF